MEVINFVEIVANDSVDYINIFLHKNGLPTYSNKVKFNRAETYIDWNTMPIKFSFFFDVEGWDEKVRGCLYKSKLRESERLDITYGWKEPVVSIPTKLFIKDWEEFVRSAKYQTLIIDNQHNLIIEVSRDYYMHSNFRII